MKLAYTVGTPDTRGKMLAYCGGSFSEVCARLKDIGYSGLELFVRDPAELDLREISGAIERYSLEIAAVGTGPVVSEDKLTFTSADEAVRATAIKRAKAAVDFAAQFGAQVNVGKLRGDVNAGNPDQSREWMRHAFQAVCSHARAKGVNITIEPQNRFVINNLNTTQQAMAWLHELAIPNLFLMLDVFHMNIEDRSIIASLIEAKEVTIHLHFAENNRGAPGVGHIDFPEIVRALKAMRYDRYISLEIDQIPDSYHAAKASFHYLHSILKED